MKYEIEYCTHKKGSMMCLDYFECEPKDAVRMAAELVRKLDGCDFGIVSDENDEMFDVDASGNIYNVDIF